MVELALWIGAGLVTFFGAVLYAYLYKDSPCFEVLVTTFGLSLCAWPIVLIVLLLGTIQRILEDNSRRQ